MPRHPRFHAPARSVAARAPIRLDSFVYVSVHLRGWKVSEKGGNMIRVAGLAILFLVAGTQIAQAGVGAPAGAGAGVVRKVSESARWAGDGAEDWTAMTQTPVRKVGEDE